MSTTVRAGVVVLQCDAIVIPQADLPTVVRESERVVSFADGTLLSTGGADDARWYALRWLALAEYRDAHPPVPPIDEADVLLLADLLAGVAPLISNSDTLARRLLTTGRVSVTR